MDEYHGLTDSEIAISILTDFYKNCFMLPKEINLPEADYRISQGRDFYLTDSFVKRLAAANNWEARTMSKIMLRLHEDELVRMWSGGFQEITGKGIAVVEELGLVSEATRIRNEQTRMEILSAFLVLQR